MIRSHKLPGVTGSNFYTCTCNVDSANTRLAPQKFQKEAIYRQMQEYKREKTSFETQLIDLRKRSAYHDDHLRAIDAWFDQVRDAPTPLSINFA